MAYIFENGLPPKLQKTINNCLALLDKYSSNQGEGRYIASVKVAGVGQVVRAGGDISIRSRELTINLNMTNGLDGFYSDDLDLEKANALVSTMESKIEAILQRLGFDGTAQTLQTPHQPI
jgi:hypothetical protein